MHEAAFLAAVECAFLEDGQWVLFPGLFHVADDIVETDIIHLGRHSPHLTAQHVRR